MASIIDDHVIQRVKEETDIVELIGRYTKLEKKGRSYMGLCPFHGEKTPSFSVQPEKNYYHCFGCGVGGDVINFVMEKEGLGFIEAVERLAEALHIELKPAYRNDKVEEKKKSVAAMNREAAIYYMTMLSRNPYALKYLKGRGIDQSMIMAFGLGFAPAGGDQLLGHLVKRGYTPEAMYEANLVSYNKTRGNYYDRFRNRIIFPIIDTRSRVVGFGGRVLDDSKPKYLNSSDTPLYKKSRELYGLNRLMKVSSRERVLLVEGYMDVISLHSQGINYAVASLGTSLTGEQARLLKRYGKKIYICYDGDEAGQRATLRATDILLAEDLRPEVVVLEEGRDPDEYIRTFGKIAFEGKLKHAKAAVDFEVELMEAAYDLEDASSLSEFLNRVGHTLGKLKTPVERDVYARKYAERYGVRAESLLSGIAPGAAVEPRKSEKPAQEAWGGHWLHLLRYALEDEDYFTILARHDEWKYVLSRGEGEVFQYLENLYHQELGSEARKERFFDAYPELIDRFQTLSKGMDLIHGEAIVRELITRIYEEGLRRRSAELIKDIEQIEAGSKDESETSLNQKLLELTEINTRLQDLEKGDNA